MSLIDGPAAEVSAKYTRPSGQGDARAEGGTTGRPPTSLEKREPRYFI
jgi:hypothetical protein